MPETQIYVDPDWQQCLIDAGIGDYESIMVSDMGIKLVKPGLGSRERIRIDDFMSPDGTAQTVFLKRYGNIGPEAIERDAIELVASAGITTMKTIACGRGHHGGFIMVTKVAGEPLSDCFEELLQKHGNESPLLNKELAEQLAQIAARLHGANLVHKDFYATHIFIDIDEQKKLKLSLIDLARVERTGLRRWKWFVKDLSGLHFSMPDDWVERNWMHFIGSYARYRDIKIPFWVHLWIKIRSGRTRKSFNRRIRRQSFNSGGK